MSFKTEAQQAYINLATRVNKKKYGGVVSTMQIGPKKQQAMHPTLLDVPKRMKHQRYNSMHSIPSMPSPHNRSLNSPLS